MGIMPQLGLERDRGKIVKCKNAGCGIPMALSRLALQTWQSVVMEFDSDYGLMLPKAVHPAFSLEDRNTWVSSTA